MAVVIDGEAQQLDGKACLAAQFAAVAGGVQLEVVKPDRVIVEKDLEAPFLAG